MHYDDSHFPLPSYRPLQRETIVAAAEAFAEGTKFVVLDGPVGSGKSAIGMALANAAGSAYYLTVTKQLQDQLAGDFSYVDVVKGRSAYPCTFYQRTGAAPPTSFRRGPPTCDDGWCKRSSGGRKSKCGSCFHVSTKGGELSVLPTGMNWSACPYYEAVETMAAGKIGVMNFHSFLFQAMTASRIQKRKLLIIDEAHQLESAVLDFVSLSLDDGDLARHGAQLPKPLTAESYVGWYHLATTAKAFWAMLQDARESDDVARSDRVQTQFHAAKKVAEYMHDDPDNWVIETVKSEYGTKASFRPIFGWPFMEELFFKHAEHVLLMSGTVLDHRRLTENLGVAPNNYRFLQMPCTFPVKNREIQILPYVYVTGGQAKMHEWGAKLVEGVDAITTTHPNERGIIHTHTHAIASLLMDRCAGRKRFLHQRDFFDKTAMLAEHALQPNSVIVAPAMHEGVDLRGELSRFQVICKTPFPNYHDDVQLARRRELQPSVIDWMTVLKLVQSAGRSVRSADDWAKTYVLDATFDGLYRRARGLFPAWFEEALVW